jgi:hypothetical protein
VQHEEKRRWRCKDARKKRLTFWQTRTSIRSSSKIDFKFHLPARLEILEENEEKSAMSNHSQGCDEILDPGL